MLKGAVLCKQYPAGYRTSNDVDLLIRPTDVTLIGNLLRDEGFRQGDIRNGVFTPAARQEIIASRMMRGETVPFIKEVGLPGMPYLEVDLNFSLDYANGDITVLDMMLQAGRDLRTLTSVDFFIHLCGHLYKEAATLPWVRMGRDMTLYKYADIYLLLSSMNEADITRLFARSARMGLDKICAYAIMQTAALFDMKVPHATSAARRVLRDDRDFLHTVISPSDRKTYLYTEKDIVKRFFHPDRKSLLREVET